MNLFISLTAFLLVVNKQLSGIGVLKLILLMTGRPFIPSIPKIQRLIEIAWQKGFDHQGSQQLGGKVTDTTKWIGATEIVATLSSLKIKYVKNMAACTR